MSESVQLLKFFLSNFAGEWTTPSLLLIRLGVPFVSGLYDVKPVVEKDKITALGLSLPNAFRFVGVSLARQIVQRLLELGLCSGLFAAGLQDDALEGESNTRHVDFSLRELLIRCCWVPREIVDRGFIISNRSNELEIQHFLAEGTKTVGTASVFRRYFARHLVADTSASILSAASFYITQSVISRNSKGVPNKNYRSAEEDLNKLVADVEVERYGIPVRKWQLQNAIGRNIAHSFGAAFGATFVSLFCNGEMLGGGNRILKSEERSSCGAPVLLFLGEFIGGSLAMAAFSSIFFKYRPLVEEAVEEEVHYQNAIRAVK